MNQRNSTIVTLRGKVEHALARQAAKEAARNTLGVDRVCDRLKVAWAGDELNDDQIAEYVRKAFIRDACTGRAAAADASKYGSRRTSEHCDSGTHAIPTA